MRTTQGGRHTARKSFMAFAVLAAAFAGVQLDGQREPATGFFVDRGDSEIGTWSEVMDWPFIPLHSGVDEQGRVFTYGSDPTGAQGGQVSYDVWDPTNGRHSTRPNGTVSDTFCSILVDDPESRGLLVIGGDERAQPGPNQFTLRYDSGVLVDTGEDMIYGRFYPTATTLWDGRVLIQGGRESLGNPVTVSEIYEPGSGWRLLPGSDDVDLYTERGGWWYPRSWVTPAGKVFGIAGNSMYYIDPEGDGAIERLGTFPNTATGATSTSVMFAPGLVLQVGGGGWEADTTDQDASPFASVIDLNEDPPVVTQVSSPHFARHWADTVVLPDGRVLLTGGSLGNNRLHGVAYANEVWDPATDTWTLWAENETPRLYHSVGMLLPDGSVFVGGGGSPGPLVLKSAEIFYPPYLFDSDGDPVARPEWTSAPRDVHYGTDFTASIADGPVDRVTIVKSGGVTHSLNQQIFMELDFTQVGTTLTIDAPELATVATPGEYFMYALRDGVPSEAAIVSVGGVTGSSSVNDEVVNGGFEQPDLDASAGTVIVPQTEVPGWSTNDASDGLELMSDGFEGISAPEGTQFLELNAAEGGSIWQDIATTPGTAYEWSFWHRGRLDSDTVEVLAGAPTAAVDIVATATSTTAEWTHHSGTYVVPPGQSVTRLQLRASDDGASGNLIDAVRFTAPSIVSPPLPPAAGDGYWMLEATGVIHPFGSVDDHGGTDGAPAVALAATPSGDGYWILGADGRVHNQGDAAFHGDLASRGVLLDAGERPTTMAATPAGDGYWIFTDRGRAVEFGAADHHGDLTHLTLNGPIVASTATPSGDGYYQVAADGGVFAHGDADYLGSVPEVLPGVVLNRPVVGVAATPDNDGYWLVASDGGVFSFGSAPYRGSVPAVLPGQELNQPVNGMVPYGDGYLLVASDGGVFEFSNLAFLGSLGADPPEHPIVAIAARASGTSD